jgi:hypothetical protein
LPILVLDGFRQFSIVIKDGEFATFKPILADLEFSELGY